MKASPAPHGAVTPTMPDAASWVADLAKVLAGSRLWHAAQQRHKLHPAVEDLLSRDLRPHDWHQLVLEWPHVSLNDHGMLAYTPDEAKALKNVVTKTTPARYIRRHWPALADHEIRDVVARVASAGLFQWRDTSDGIVDGVQNGPGSCMRWDPEEFECDECEKPHPYRAYCPSCGWRMAVRFNEQGRIDGRALVYTDESGQSVFVRSFRRCFDSSWSPDQETYSQADEALESWLREQGVRKKSQWPNGTRLAKVMYNGDFIVPYLDGDHHNFDDEGSHLAVHELGEFCADNTDGTYEHSEGSYTCECCGNRIREIALYAGRYEDQPIGRCCEDDYVYVQGQGGDSYYLHQDNDYIVEVGTDYYDSRYLEDNDIVELANGDYCKRDDACFCEITDEYHHVDNCTYVEDLQAYVCDEEAWECSESGHWYSSQVEPVIDAEGNKYHPDHAPDDCDEEDEEPVNLPTPTVLNDPARPDPVFAIAA